MKPMSKPTDLAQALEEIDRLRELLAEVERSRDSYQHLMIKMLPPAPPELELSVSRALPVRHCREGVRAALC